MVFKPTEDELAKLVKQLRAADSREEGRIILDEHCKTVTQLKLLGKHLHIPVYMYKKKLELKERIIQATIGHRIDSMVIQNHKWDD